MESMFQHVYFIELIKIHYFYKFFLNIYINIYAIYKGKL